MNDIYGVFFVGVFTLGIEDENHLQLSSAVSAPDNPPFTLFAQLRIRRPSVFDDQLRLLGRDAVFGDVFDIPLVPSE